jgi:hypothetical protein
MTDDSLDEDGNYLAFTTSIGCSHESSVYTTPNLASHMRRILRKMARKLRITSFLRNVLN